jgi:hypothetical protein
LNQEGREGRETHSKGRGEKTHEGCDWEEREGRETHSKGRGEKTHEGSDWEGREGREAAVVTK